jgi:hypothetical protein
MAMDHVDNFTQTPSKKLNRFPNGSNHQTKVALAKKQVSYRELFEITILPMRPKLN